MTGHGEGKDAGSERDWRHEGGERGRNGNADLECPDGILTRLFIHAPGILGEFSPGLEAKAVFRADCALSPEEIAALAEHRKLRFG